MTIKRTIRDFSVSAATSISSFTSFRFPCPSQASLLDKKTMLSAMIKVVSSAFT